MRDSLRALLTRLRPGWILPLALLALPNCAQIAGIDDWDPKAPPGPIPRTSAIFCDIQQPPGPDCAMADEEAMGIRLEEAATALVSGEKKLLGLDYSQGALDACNGLPRKTPFQDWFPDGFSACLNCSEIGSNYADALAFCVAKCADLTDGNTAFCNQPGVVKLATNFVPENSACYADACFEEGTAKADFPDPRRHPEPVDWQDLVNVTPNGGTLTRDAGDGTQFDAGADAPKQTITHGNAYVQFTVGGPNVTRLAGLSEGPGDMNPGFESISFAIDLFKDGCVYIFEQGVQVNGSIETCTVPHAFGGYVADQVFRVRVKDNLDGTGEFAPMGGHATVTYTRLMGSCVDGNVCAEEMLWTSQSVAQYPLRVDASFHEVGGTLTDVKIVRIRPQ